MGANLGKVLHQVPVINLQISSVVLLDSSLGLNTLKNIYNTSALFQLPCTQIAQILQKRMYPCTF